MDLELRHHRYAIALAEHRHFLRAARALGISQPALSRSIQELERRMGAVLFHRSRDGVEATDVGRVFLARAHAVLAHVGDLEREMRLMQGLGAIELRVGAGVYPSEMFVAAAIAHLAKSHPQLKLTIVSNSIDVLLQMLRRREIDLVIGDLKTAEADRSVRATPMAWHRGYLVVRAGHPLLREPKIRMKDVLRFPLALTTRVPPDLLSQLFQGRGERGASPNLLPAITCDSPSVMKTIVAESDAITLMPVSLIRRELADGTLTTLPVEAPWLGRTFALIELPTRTPSPAAEQFMRHVIELDAQAARVEMPTARRAPRVARAAEKHDSSPLRTRKNATKRGS
jgi:DNA-binding transcriptional LysR family regulator